MPRHSQPRRNGRANQHKKAKPKNNKKSKAAKPNKKQPQTAIVSARASPLQSRSLDDNWENLSKETKARILSVTSEGISGALTYALNHGRSPHVICMNRSDPLMDQDAFFQDPKRLCKTGDNNVLTSQQARHLKLVNLLTPVLYQFYAYQQLKHKLDYAGIVLIETKESDTLKDIVPNCQPGEGLDLRSGSVVTVSYLSSAAMIDFYYKARDLVSSERQKVVQTSAMVLKHGLRDEYFPVSFCANFGTYTNTVLLRRPDCIDENNAEPQKIGKMFEANINRCGVHNCQALKIFLAEQEVYALDLSMTFLPM